MQLNQKAKARREQGLFVAEGRRCSWKHRKLGFQVFVSETFFPGWGTDGSGREISL